MNDHIPSGLGAVDRVDSGAGAQSVHQASAVPSAVVSVSEAGMTGAHAASEPVAKVFVKDGHWDRGHYIDRKTWHAQPLAALEKLANGTLLYAHPAPAWQPIETAPKGRTVMAGYWNSLRKWRTVIACYYLPQTLELDDQYSDDGDGFAPEGWYEESESLETIQFTEEPPTHWMPLPAPPAAATGGKTA